MTKEQIFKIIHKPLYIYETDSYVNYLNSLMWSIVQLKGLIKEQSISSQKILQNSILALQGLHEMQETEINYNDIRRIILRLVNNVDRGIK